MKKILFDRDKCFGCGACCSIAQNNFTFDDDGKATMINDEATKEAIEASECCPTKAFTIVDNETCNCNTESHCCCDECNCDSTCSCGDNCECTEENHCGCK